MPAKARFSVGRTSYPSGSVHSRSVLGRQLNRSLNQVMRNLDDFVRHVEEITPDIMVEALKPTLDKAKYYCPKDTGELVNSAFLEVQQATRGYAQAVMGFGKGGRPDYAVYVHEMPNDHAAPTRDKFLQTALDEDMNNILRSLQRQYLQVTGDA